jgi:hypothetical protein
MLEGEKRDTQVHCVHPMGHSIPALTEDSMKSLDNFLRRGSTSPRMFRGEADASPATWLESSGKCQQNGAGLGRIILRSLSDIAYSI